MHKTRVFGVALTLLSGLGLSACGGDAEPIGEAKQFATAPAWDPGFTLGANNNEWWIEVFVSDSRTDEIVVSKQNGGTIRLSPTSWGSYAANERIRRGTSIRLTFRRDDGQTATTNYFRYLREEPSLEQPSVPTEPEPPETPGDPTATYTVSGNKILDTCGQEVLLRGVNKMHIWTDPSGSSLPEIAKTGANTVRIVWDTSGTPAALDALVQRARDNGLLPMIELHDATGNLAGVPALVDWWVKRDVVSLIAKHESALLVNIANEAGDWDQSASAWVNTYKTAISSMRSAGIRTPLVVDALGWGHDVDLIVSHGPQVLAADPLKNVIFSTHQYQPVRDVGTSYYATTLTNLANSGLAVVVGEFGNVAWDCALEVDYKGLVAAAATHRVGWYAWSWGPGNNPCSGLDMTRDSSYATLHGWGLEVASTLPGSIKNTSKPVRVSSSGSCP